MLLIEYKPIIFLEYKYKEKSEEDKKFDLLIENFRKEYECKNIPKEFFEHNNYSYHNNELNHRIFMRQVDIIRYKFFTSIFWNGNKL